MNLEKEMEQAMYLDCGSAEEDLFEYVRIAKQYAEEMCGWISVEDKLPEEFITVIVPGGIAQYKGGNWYTGMEEPLFLRQIVWEVPYWMPLPNAPLATEKKDE